MRGVCCARDGSVSPASLQRRSRLESPRPSASSESRTGLCRCVRTGATGGIRWERGGEGAGGEGVTLLCILADRLICRPDGSAPGSE